MRDELNDALRELPAERARAGFTADVIRRVDRPRRSKGQLLAAVVLAAVAATATFTVVERRRDAARAELVRELAELRKEREAIRRDLAALQELHQSASRTLYLGGTDQRDYVLDTTILPARFIPPGETSERRTP